MGFGKYTYFFPSQMIEELVKHACSNGEDIDIQLYFAGRHRELYQALDAVDKHGMVAIGGYSSSGKTYLALKLLDRLGVSVKNKPYHVTKELINSDTPALGIMCEVNPSQSLVSFQNIFERLLQGSSGYHGLLALIGDTALRRELNLKLSSLLLSNDSRDTMPIPNFNALLGILSEAISIIKTQAAPKEIIICIDCIDRIENTNALNDLVDCLQKAKVKLIFTFNTSLTYFPIHALAKHIPQLQSIYINRLTDEETDELIDLIEANTKYSLHFDTKARNLLRLASGNIPYFVHFLCAPALVAAYQANKSIINENDVDLEIENVRVGRYTSSYEKIYSAITESPIQVDRLMEYALMPNLDLCHHEPPSPQSSKFPVGGLLIFRDESFVIANPAIQVYARLRLGVKG